MKFHKIADIFPLLPDAELKSLAEDIKANGLKQPIILFEEKILDGRNRFRACELAGVKPAFKFYEGDSPASFVISLNLQRRHLSESQKAAVAAEALPWLEREAKVRQLATLKKGTALPAVEKLPQREARSRDKAGDLFGVSGRYVSEAKAIQKSSPKEFEAIKKGDKTISQVKRETTKAETLRRVKEFPTGKYRVVYADPPWKYGDTLSGSLSESYGGAEKHYPSLSISELCNLPVGDLADENAVLFLWVTSPLLFECERVFRSWGFEYKASFVWDKVKHNMGHYNSVRHEFLLVCTKGSCTPEVNKLFDSVQTIERTEKHSEKPEPFRKIIETLYPTGKKIELFARSNWVGWDKWGTELAITPLGLSRNL